ncbi:MAG: hypothetical protein M0T74_11830 [Desulfitobacterium hafniense]|nr:hypothetical protein [Desulfitobacterium hafniense]
MDFCKSNMLKIEQKSVDPVSLLSAGVQIYFPVTEHISIGILFETIGLIKIYVQQHAIPDDILIQVKIIKVNVPIALGLLFFNLGLAAFYTKAVITLLRNHGLQITAEVQENINNFLIKMNEINKKVE